MAPRSVAGSIAGGERHRDTEREREPRAEILTNSATVLFLWLTTHPGLQRLSLALPCPPAVPCRALSPPVDTPILLPPTAYYYTATTTAQPASSNTQCLLLLLLLLLLAAASPAAVLSRPPVTVAATAIVAAAAAVAALCCGCKLRQSSLVLKRPQ